MLQSAMASNYGGLDYSFVDKKKQDKFTCSTCHLVFKDPHLTGCCGQHFCESCLKHWFTKRGKESCTHCRTEGKEFKYLVDKKFKREIDSLRIHCTNKEEGCQWIGEVGSLKDHLESANGCGYVEVECPNGCLVPTTAIQYRMKRKTMKKMQRRDLENHVKKKCYLRPCQCVYCGQRDTYEAITGDWHSVPNKTCHYRKCPEFPLVCPNRCCRNDIKRKDIKDHRGQCPEEPVQCPFKEAGCKKRLVRCELEQHMSATQQQHLLMVMGAYKEMKKENSRIKNTLDDTLDELDEMKKRLNRKRKRTDNYNS